MIYNSLDDSNRYSISNHSIDLELGHNRKQSQTHLTQALLNDGLFNYIKNVYFYTGIGWCTLLIFSELMSYIINKENLNLIFWIYLLT